MNQLKMYKCIRLMQMLQDNPRHIHTIARYLNVTERTVYRYISLYKSLGYKIIKDKFNKIKIEK
jgi:predicted DNA-binding transcriptional regulator YafY